MEKKSRLYFISILNLFLVKRPQNTVWPVLVAKLLLFYDSFLWSTPNNATGIFSTLYKVMTYDSLVDIFKSFLHASFETPVPNRFPTQNFFILYNASSVYHSLQASKLAADNYSRYIVVTHCQSNLCRL